MGDRRDSSIEGIVSGVMEDGPMGVGADLHRATGLAFVAIRIHVADDRVGDLAVRRLENLDGTDVDHLMNRRRQRDGGTGHLGQARCPYAAADDHVLSRDIALVGLYAGDPAFVSRDVGHLGDRRQGDRVEIECELTHQGSGLE